MNILEYVKSQDWEYIVKGENIGLKYCPVCGAKSFKDGQVKKDNLYSFYISSRTGLYHCFRGGCDVKGHINTLAKKEIYKSDYQKPKDNFSESNFNKEIRNLGKFELISNNIDSVKYLENRGISEKTATKYGCRALKDTGDIIVPCYDNGILCNYKRRFLNPIIANGGRELKTKNSSTGRSVFYGMHNCVDEDKPLVVVEGEMDLLAVLEAGYNNVVSVPNGAGSDSFLDNCYEFLDYYKSIIVWFDNDVAGKKGFEKLARKLNNYDLMKVVSVEKDANDVLIEKGKEAVLEYVKNSKPIPIDGIVFAKDVKRKKIANLKRVSSGIYGLDYYLRGFREGELTIWSGKNSSGKTTLLGQIMLNLIEQGEKIFAYSGELSTEMFKEWMYSQACSEYQLVKYKDEMSKTTEYEASDLNYMKIERWIDEKLIIYNKSDIAREEELLEVMKRVYKKYGCRNFFLDNLMMMEFDDKEKNIYLQQSDFTKKVKGFITNNNSHCHLVVHPYKTDKKFINKDDIGGSGNIVNSADNVLIMHNLSKMDGQDFPARLSIEKNRVGGKIGDVSLEFEYQNKRFYTPTDKKERDKTYSWNNIEIKKDIEYSEKIAVEFLNNF